MWGLPMALLCSKGDLVTVSYLALCYWYRKPVLLEFDRGEVIAPCGFVVVEVAAQVVRLPAVPEDPKAQNVLAIPFLVFMSIVKLCSRISARSINTDPVSLDSCKAVGG